LLALTAEGIATLARITKAARKWHIALAGEVNSEELAMALGVVRQLCEATEKAMGVEKSEPRNSVVRRN